MQYLITFLEGIITFVSPCLLPLLPVYLSYFAGGGPHEGKSGKVLGRALGFVGGFTLVFVILGAFAGTIGMLLRRHMIAVNLITGLVVVLFGLNYLGVLRIGFLNNIHRKAMDTKSSSVFSAFVFGIVFSIGWTPCAGAFLGSALLLASQQGHALDGLLLLLCYSAGLGIPFLASAILIDRLKSAFNWIKAHYQLINRISGGLLVILGILMMTGMMSRLLLMLSF